MEVEFEKIVKEVVRRTEISLDYAKASGELAAEMGVEHDDCPYDKDSHEFLAWRDGFLGSRKVHHHRMSF